ncbi:MAG: ECF transporter S component [Clostridia bacterium]|nr:ECF transporter S component [Clostridia bacterium]
MRSLTKKRVTALVTAAMLLALGLVLPSLVGNIKEIGDSLLPMHLAVMLCGILCGGWYGLGTGLMMPFLRAVFFGMPPLYPNAVWMALELATYGLVIGLLYARGKAYRRGYLFFCLVSSMLLGRVVWGIAKAVLLGIGGKPFGWQAFFVGGFIDAVPGLLLQLVLIPLTVELLEKRKK